MNDMTPSKPMDSCGWICWALAAVGGIVLFLLLNAVIWTILAVLLALAAFVGLGIWLRQWFCTDESASAPGSDVIGTASSANAGAASASADREAGTEGSSVAPAPDAATDRPDTAGPAAAAVAPATAMGAAPAGDTPAKAAKTSKPAAKKPAAASANKKTAPAKPKSAASAPAAPAPTTTAPATPAPAAPAPAAAPVTAPVSVAEKMPVVLDAPRGGMGDDLKRIKGVGPGLEKTLNELGVYHYDQIAAWSEDEIEWVDARLRFKGRIRRDDWISQARALMAEG